MVCCHYATPLCSSKQVAEVVGMASTANERVVYLDDILGDGYDEIEHRDGELYSPSTLATVLAEHKPAIELILSGWPSVGLRFKKGSDVQLYHQRLLAAAEQANGSFAVYVDFEVVIHITISSLSDCVSSTNDIPVQPGSLLTASGTHTKACLPDGTLPA